MRAIIALLCLAVLAQPAQAVVVAARPVVVARPAPAPAARTVARTPAMTEHGTVAKLHSEPSRATPAPAATPSAPWYYFGFGSSSRSCDKQKEKDCR